MIWTFAFLKITAVLGMKQFTPLDIDNFPCSPQFLKRATRYVCDSAGEVTCLTGWEKDDNEDPLHPCSKPICEGCDNGECVAPDTCACDVGWSGENCTTCIPFPGCRYGGCQDEALTCKCDVGYEGSLCDIPICDVCVNGVCASPQDCSCFPGWSDIEGNCTVCIKHAGCMHGDCIDDQGVAVGNGCFCDAGWTGALCDRPNCEKGCINGECRILKNTSVCVCSPGWKGENCSECIPYPGCPGTCEKPWECSCFNGENSLLCYITPQIPPTPPPMPPPTPHPMPPPTHPPTQATATPPPIPP